MINTNNYSNLPRKNKSLDQTTLYLFYLLFGTFFIFVIAFILFLFTLNVYFGATALCLTIILGLELLVYFRKQGFDSQNKLLQYHKEKQDLLQEKNILLKQFFRQSISSSSFEELLDKIEANLLELDYKIQSVDLKDLTESQELKQRMQILNKKYMKQEISQKLFDKLKLELERQLSCTKKSKS
jgi:hypothetical protein